MYYFLLLVLFSCSAVCEDCVTFNFENGLEEFNNEVRVCEALDMWNFGKYSEPSMDGFHEKSSVFAYPLSSLSCMSSPLFLIKAGGTFEINLYLKPNVQMYQIVFLIFRYIENNIDTTVLSKNLNLKEGWQSINFTVDGFESYLGYIVLMGIADPQSLLLDSLRYIAPSSNEAECRIYQENEDTATETPTVTPTDIPTSTATQTFTSTASYTSTPTDTSTSTVTQTETTSFTSTELPTSTNTPAEIPITFEPSSSTFTPTETHTSTSTHITISKLKTLKYFRIDKSQLSMQYFSKEF